MTSRDEPAKLSSIVHSQSYAEGDGKGAYPRWQFGLGLGEKCRLEDSCRNCSKLIGYGRKRRQNLFLGLNSSEAWKWERAIFIVSVNLT